MPALPACCANVGASPIAFQIARAHTRLWTANRYNTGVVLRKVSRIVRDDLCQSVHLKVHGLNAPFMKARFILLAAKPYFAEHPGDEN